MRVNINGMEYEYKSDYPVGWIRRNRDFFKFPVRIGNYSCFIKRFENQNPSSISGWELLVMLEMGHGSNLVTVYDIKSVEEKSKRVYYVFYEGLSGDTLDIAISKHTPINLAALAKDMIQAIASLQKRNFWFADFVEANIFLEEGGRFVLIDLDSAQPVSKAPAENMQGSKNYWGPVFDFYTKILKYANLKVSDLSGISLNYLQVIFLILRLKLLSFYQQGTAPDPDASNNLHNQLEEIAPAFNELFIRVYHERISPRYEDNAYEIEKLINQEIIAYTPGMPNPAGAYEDNHEIEIYPEVIRTRMQTPELVDLKIMDFSASPDIVENEEIFELNWEVNDADYIELYKDGELDDKFTDGERSVTKYMYSDGKKTYVSYRLIAYKNNEKIESDVLYIRIKAPVSESANKIVEKYPEPKVNKAVKRLEPAEEDKNTADTKPPAIEFAVENYTEKNGDDYMVESGKPFNLTWNVQGAMEIQIQKDGRHFKTVNNTVKSTAVTEDLNGEKEKEVNYSLSASFKGTSNIQVKSLKIIVKPSRLAIKQFKASKYILRNGGSFNLSWNVQNATEISVYRNNVLSKTLSGKEKSIEANERYEGIQRNVKYSIHAANGLEKIESQALNIVVKPPFPIKIVLAAVAGLVLLIAAYFIFFGTGPGNDIVFYPLTYNKVSTGDTITILVKDFPESDSSLTVKFNDKNGKIVKSKNDSIQVEVPQLGEQTKNVNIVANVKSKTYPVAQNVLYVSKIIIPRGPPKLFPFSSSLITQNDIITISGQNLPTLKGAIQIRFNGVEATVIQQTREGISVSVPPVRNKRVVDIRAFMNGEDIVLAQGIPYRSSNVEPRVPQILGFNGPDANEGQVITIRGANLPTARGTAAVFFNDEPGAIIKQDTKEIRVIVPLVPGAVNSVNISVMIAARNLRVFNNVSYKYKGKETPANPPSVIRISEERLVEKNYIQIIGANFPTKPGTVIVKFNNTPAYINTQNPGALRVQVPTVPGGVNMVNISVIIDGQTIKVFNNVSYQLKPPE